MALDAQRRLSLPANVFVGREWELGQLQAALKEAQAGRGQVLVVSGEAGIGKTRLVRKLAEIAEDERTRVLWGRSWEGEAAPAFWPWVQIFRNLAFIIEREAAFNATVAARDDLTHLVPELSAFLAPDLTTQPPSDQLRFRLFDTATTLINRAAAVRPLVLILEDVHGADRSSLLLLEFLARQLQNSAVLVLVTSREPESDMNAAVRDTLAGLTRNGHRIPLTGLERDEVREFLSRGFDIFLRDDSLSAVHEKTGGNPFFLDELARRFVAEGHLREGPGGGLEVPEGLKGPTRARLSLLTAEARHLLSLASVIGREFSLELLVAASRLPRDAVLASLSKLFALRLLDPAGSGLGPYRFTHAIVRETIYQELADEERWSLHRRTAEAIEALYQQDLDVHLDQLAHHFRQSAALGDPDRAIEYSRRAGLRAIRQLGYDEATGHYEQALKLAQAAEYPSSARVDLLLALGEAQWWAGHVREADETFRTAASLARKSGDARRLAEAALRVGEVGYGGAYMQAWSFDALKVDLLEEALSMLDGEESSLKVRLLARLSTALYFSPFDSHSKRESLSRAAVELARHLGDAKTVAYALNARHLAVWSPDNLEERLTLASEIVRLAQETADVTQELTGRVWMLADLLETGDMRAADREIEAFEAVARRVAYPRFVAYASMFGAMQAMLRGDFAGTETLAQRSLELGERVGDVNVRLSHHVQMGVLRALQGWAGESATHLDLVARAHPPELGVLVKASLLCLAGDPTRAREAFFVIWHSRDQIPPAFFLAHGAGLVWTVVAAGAVQEAAAMYELLGPYEHRWALAGRDAVANLGPISLHLGRLAAMLSRFDAASRHFEVALEAAVKAGSRPYLALTQEAFGTMLLTMKEPSDRLRGAQLLTDAVKTAEEIGMSQLRERAVMAHDGLGGTPVANESQLSRSSSDHAALRCEGEYWKVEFGGHVVRLKDSKGVRYLRRLLSDPGREFHVLDLAAHEAPGVGGNASDYLLHGYSLLGMAGEEVLDSAAKSAYRARIDELRTELEEAEACNDLGRTGRLREEIEFIAGELARAVGLGGRDRRAASSAERARSSVTKALRAVLARIGRAHAALGAHLAITIKTGYFCSYNPDPRAPVKWET